MRLKKIGQIGGFDDKLALASRRLRGFKRYGQCIRQGNCEQTKGTELFMVAKINPSPLFCVLKINPSPLFAVEAISAADANG